jgi:hypothetical protein
MRGYIAKVSWLTLRLVLIDDFVEGVLDNPFGSRGFQSGD